MNNTVQKIIGNPVLELAMRLILGGIFVYASYHKIVEPARFAKVIYGYGLFPEYSINLIAIILPFLELYAGFALILGIYPKTSALLINIMLFAFIIALSINLARGHEFDCGCMAFGEAGSASSTAQLLVRDILMFMAGIHIVLFKKRRISLREAVQFRRVSGKSVSTY